MLDCYIVRVTNKGVIIVRIIKILSALRIIGVRFVMIIPALSLLRMCEIQARR